MPFDKGPPNGADGWTAVPSGGTAANMSSLGWQSELRAAVLVVRFWQRRGLLRLTRSLLPGPETEKDREIVCVCVWWCACWCLCGDWLPEERQWLRTARRLLGNVCVTGVTRARQKHRAAVTDTFLARDNLQTHSLLTRTFMLSFHFLLSPSPSLTHLQALWVSFPPASSHSLCLCYQTDIFYIFL